VNSTNRNILQFIEYYLISRIQTSVISISSWWQVVMNKILLNFAAENTINSHSIQTAGSCCFLCTRSMTYYKEDKLLSPPPPWARCIFHSPHTLILKCIVWSDWTQQQKNDVSFPCCDVRNDFPVKMMLLSFSPICVVGSWCFLHVIFIYARIMVSNTISISGDILRVVLIQLQPGSSRDSCGVSWCPVFIFLCTVLFTLMHFCSYSFGHCIVCFWSIYGFWLPFGIFKFVMPCNSGVSLWIRCCNVRYNVRIKTMYDSSLPPVVCRRAHVLYTYVRTVFTSSCL
jgi:hypothetical protein